MKPPEPFTFDLPTAVKEVEEFSAHLAANTVLKERADVLAFFRARANLSSLCGVLSSKIEHVDRVAWEFDLFGVYVCDLVVGDSERNAYCFVEFENALPDSIFKRSGRRASRAWSPRFEGGYSQVIDWFHKLSNMAHDEDFEDAFGKRTISHDGALVIGRSGDITTKERARLAWREERVIVDSKRIRCVTFDDLLGLMQTRLRTRMLLESLNRAP